MKMSFTDALNCLCRNYGQYATRAQYIQMLRSGIEKYGLSVNTVYNGIRMMLGEPDELFTLDDICEITGETREELIERIELYRAEAERLGMNPDIIARPIKKTTYTVKL